MLWLVYLGFAMPWVVPIVWFWHQRPRDGAVPPSMADLARKRLWRI